MSRGRPPSASAPLSLRRVPLASSLTPWQALLTLRADRRPFALTGAWAGGGAILGSEPTLVAPAGADPFVSLGSLPAVQNDLDGAVGGGWFGRLGYPASFWADRVPPQPPRPIVARDASLAWYDHELRLDADGRWWFECLWSDEAAERLDARLELLRERLAGPSPEPAPFDVGTFTPRPSRAGHEAAVAQCVEYIEAGDLYQANLTLRLESSFTGDAIDLFASAASALRPRYAAFVAAPDLTVASLSPELFLRRRGRDVVTAPIKGTAPRPDDEGEARRSLARLESSAKDHAENVMILDLMRNDLGRVSEYGTVRVTDVARAEAHAGVWHLVSEVAGTLREDVGDAELLRGTFPPGSVTGAPKLKALEVIATLESTGRETYTGAIGFASPVAGLELNVAIRTFEVAGERIWLGVGGGVVADSVPAAEYEECLVKARPLVEAVGGRLADDSSPAAPTLGVSVSAASPAAPTRASRPDPARGVFTTLAIEEGVPVEADRHLARLAASVRALYGLEIDLDIPALPVTGRHRLRIDVLPSGETATRIAPAGPAFPATPIALRPLVVPGGVGEHKWIDRPLLDEAEGERLIVDLDGTVLETSRGNVCLVEEGSLVTPPADGRILPGVTRALVLERVGAREERVTVDRLEAADEVFVTSAIRVLQPVRSGPVTRAVAAELRRAAARTGTA